jgi:hypothetical protein
MDFVNAIALYSLYTVMHSLYSPIGLLISFPCGSECPFNLGYSLLFSKRVYSCTDATQYYCYFRDCPMHKSASLHPRRHKNRLFIPLTYVIDICCQSTLGHTSKRLAAPQLSNRTRDFVLCSFLIKFTNYTLIVERVGFRYQ